MYVCMVHAKLKFPFRINFVELCVCTYVRYIAKKRWQVARELFARSREVRYYTSCHNRKI